MQDRDRGTSGWTARPVLAGVLRAAIAIGPVLASLGTSLIVVRMLPTPRDSATTIGVITTALASSLLVLLLAERLTRRFIPLALLLNMSLLFPDKAPPRYRVARRAASIRHLREQVERAQCEGRVDEPILVAENILTLISGLTVHDKRTRGHSERVRVYTDLLTERLGLPTADRERLRWASLIHDIGKLEVSPQLLNKPGRPTEAEWEELKAHPAEGARIAASMMPWLGEWGHAIVHHHERFDGAGYPGGLAGASISQGGRIVAVADAYETMTAVRSYKSAITHVAARQELARCAGTQFDPAVVKAFLDIPLTQLVRVSGPISWFLQLPLLRQLQPVAHQLGPQFAAAGASVATAAAVTAVAVSQPGGGATLPTGFPDASAIRSAIAAATAELPAVADPGTDADAATTIRDSRPAPRTAPSGGDADAVTEVATGADTPGGDATGTVSPTRRPAPTGQESPSGASQPDRTSPPTSPASPVAAGGTGTGSPDPTPGVTASPLGGVGDAIAKVTDPVVEVVTGVTDTVTGIVTDTVTEVPAVIDDLVTEVVPVPVPVPIPSIPLAPAPAPTSSPEPEPILPVPTPTIPDLGGILGGLSR